jgi:hypothetical protein
VNTRAANGREDHAAGLTFADLAATVATGRELSHLELVLRDELARGRVLLDDDRYRANPRRVRPGRARRAAPALPPNREALKAACAEGSAW